MTYEESITNKESIREGLEDWKQEEISWMSEVVPEFNAEIYANRDYEKKFSSLRY